MLCFSTTQWRISTHGEMNTPREEAQHLAVNVEALVTQRSYRPTASSLLLNADSCLLKAPHHSRLTIYDSRFTAYSSQHRSRSLRQ